MTLTTATIGGNFPPSPIEALRLALAEDAGELFARRDDLLSSASRTPEIVDDDETAGKVGDLIKLIGAAMKAAETARLSAKEPHLAAGRAVDGFFKTAFLDPLDRAKQIIQSRLGIFLEQKALAARRAAEALAEREHAEARRLAAEAAEAKADANWDAVFLAEERAQSAAALAEAKPAELSQTRGDLGSLAGLRTNWEFEITDIAQVPRNFLMLNEAAIRGHIRARLRDQPPAAVPGIRFFTKSSTVVR